MTDDAVVRVLPTMCGAQVEMERGAQMRTLIRVASCVVRLAWRNPTVTGLVLLLVGVASLPFVADALTTRFHETPQARAQQARVANWAAALDALEHECESDRESLDAQYSSVPGWVQRSSVVLVDSYRDPAGRIGRWDLQWRVTGRLDYSRASVPERSVVNNKRLLDAWEDDLHALYARCNAELDDLRGDGWYTTTFWGDYVPSSVLYPGRWD